MDTIGRALAGALSMLLTLGCGREDSPPSSGPKGKPKEEGTRILETSVADAAEL